MAIFLFILILKLLRVFFTHFFSILQALPTCTKEIVELLDIILRWFVLRFCESNTTCLLKVHFLSVVNID